MDIGNAGLGMDRVGMRGFEIGWLSRGGAAGGGVVIRDEAAIAREWSDAIVCGIALQRGGKNLGAGNVAA